MRIVLLVFLVVLATLDVAAQSLPTKRGEGTNDAWAKNAGGSGGDYGEDIAVDASGNIYVTGYFQTTADFNGITLVSAGKQDVFVAKYHPDGSIAWAKRAGSHDDDAGLGLTLDQSGDIYITGGFRDSIDFSGITLMSAGNNDMFVAKYHPDGQIAWAKRDGGNDYDVGFDLSVDASGNVYVTGGESRNGRLQWHYPGECGQQ